MLLQVGGATPGPFYPRAHTQYGANVINFLSPVKFEFANLRALDQLGVSCTHFVSGTANAVKLIAL